MGSVCFQGKPFNITVIQVYAPTNNTEVEQFYEDLQDLLELTPNTKHTTMHIMHLLNTMENSILQN